MCAIGWYAACLVAVEDTPCAPLACLHSTAPLQRELELTIFPWRYCSCKQCNTCCLICDIFTLFAVQGVSLEYLTWLKMTFGASIGLATVEQVCQMYIKPRTSRSQGSVAQELTANARTRHHVGPASWFISHIWSNPFANTLDALLLFFERRDDLATTFVWLDFLVFPQIDIDDSLSCTMWMPMLYQNIARIGSLLLVVDAWDNPTALRRAW